MANDSPDSVQPDSIQPLDTLPVFFRARGRRMVVAAESDGAAWKVELLAAAGAKVDVYAPAPSERLERVAGGSANVALHRRRWVGADFRGALAVIAEAQSDDEAREIAAAARAVGAPVNIIDRPDFCDFQFGSIVNRSPLVVAISTGGAAPVFGQALRARIETLLPPGLADWAQAARSWRQAIAGLPFRARRTFWEIFARRALDAPARAPSEADRAEIAREAGLDERAARPARGRALLVGAGPGDPELLTLKAVRALQSADVVLYDDLASPAALDMARREAEKIDVGKLALRASPKQADITALFVELVSAGKTVVRLKGGDPMIFGRAGEEIAALARAGLDVEIVPGVTAASGAAAELRVSLTDRDLAPRVQFVTGHGPDGRLPDLDWGALADPRACTVVYMGSRNLESLAEKLLAHGLSPQTPVALVSRATRPDAAALRSTLGDIGRETGRVPADGPTIVLIGAAMDGGRFDAL